MDSITATILILFGVAAGCIVARSVIETRRGNRPLPIFQRHDAANRAVMMVKNLPLATTAERTAQDATDAAGRSHITQADADAIRSDWDAVGADLAAVMQTGPRLSNTPPTLPTINHRADEFPRIITPATPPSPACCTTACKGQ